MGRRVPILLCLQALLVYSCTAKPTGNSAFQTVECWFAVPAGANVTCGFVDVPEDRSKPVTPENTIQLAIAVFHSSTASPAPDPVVYQVGGPGGHMLALVPHIYEKVIEPFLARRNLILFDPRGTGFSKPALECKDGESPGDCIRRLFTEGHNLYAYNSVSMANDMQDLRAALGYNHWNLLGESYGTHVAQITLLEAPAGLRSVILDSVMPVVIPELPNSQSSFEVALQRLFQRCVEDSDCNAAYPDLYDTLLKAVQRLDQNPVSLSTNCNGQEKSITLTGDRLASMLSEALYEAALIPALPHAITSAADGSDYSFWSNVLCWEAGIDGILTDGVHWAVQCSDGRLGNECENWPVVVEQRLVTGDIPVLILNGELDPVTPLEYGHSVAEGLSNSYVYDFPGLGHWVNGTGHPCQIAIIQSFLEHPDRQPDSACITAMNKLNFVFKNETP